MTSDPLPPELARDITQYLGEEADRSSVLEQLGQDRLSPGAFHTCRLS